MPLTRAPFAQDNLKQITREALVRHVLESCAVVVLLNDEACQSEWVALELRTAASAGIPIIAVIDQDNFSMPEIVSWHLANGFGHALCEQAIGYTQQQRKAWVEDKGKLAPAWADDIVDTLAVLSSEKPRKSIKVSGQSFKAKARPPGKATSESQSACAVC